MGLLDRFRKNTAKQVQEELEFARKLHKDGLTGEACIGFEKVFGSPAATPRQKEQALRYLLHPWPEYEGFEALFDGDIPSYDDYGRRAAYGGCYGGQGG